MPVVSVLAKLFYHLPVTQYSRWHPVQSYDAVYLGNGKHRVSTVSREEDPSNDGNHSCDPNIASVDDEMIALRDIEAGEELTIDYTQYSPKIWSMKCNCGAKNCTGIVRGKL
jgi:SET domain-containing protein